MKIIFIGAYLFDIAGHFFVRIDPVESNLDSTMRRISRQATLDGNSIITDNGYTPADSTFEIVIPRLSKTDHSNLKRLVRLHSEIVVCNEDGAFLGSVQTITEDKFFRIFFLVKQKLSE